MAKSELNKTILCTWEMGADLGHISRLSSITKKLEAEGYTVFLALKDLSRAYPYFKDTRAQILQAPTWLLKLKMQRPIACQADVLLLSGYLDSEILAMLINAWQTIIDLINPDAIIFDYSPTAQLAFRSDNRPKIIIGTGFSEPEAGHPLTDWRHYSPNDDLVSKQESVALHSINKTLETLNRPPLRSLSELWRVDKMILDEFHFFDPYHHVRSNTTYCLKPKQGNSHPKLSFSNTGQKKIVAYLKSKHPKLELILRALKASACDVILACPMGPETALKAFEGDNFKYSTKLIDLPDALSKADLFLGHGNAGSVKEAIDIQIPMLVLPIQQEQLLIGKQLESLGIGKMVVDFNSEKELSDVILNTVSRPDYSEKMSTIKNNLMGESRSIADIIIDALEYLLE